MKLFLTLSLTCMLIGCNDAKHKNGSSTDQATADEFNIGIDTAAITNQESLLQAARTFKAAKEKEDLNKENPSYKKHYYTLLKYKGILSKRMAAITDTMPGNKRQAFIQQYREIIP